MSMKIRLARGGSKKRPHYSIVATDSRFYEHLPTMFPAYDARPMFAGNASAHRSSCC